jgi:hypothetical protein
MPVLVDQREADDFMAEVMVRTQMRAKTVATLLQYENDPVGFITEHLHEHVWSKQREIAQSVGANRRTAVHSAHEVGKSWLAARIVSWWLSCHGPGSAFAVTTAPSAPQVRAILWREIGRAHRAGHLPGRLNLTEWWYGKEIVGFGRKPSEYEPTAFQGIHAKYVLVVLDEACGIPESLWTAAGSLTANEYSRILAIGNPDDPGAHFAKVCAPGTDWNVIQVDGYDSPNYTGENVPDDLKPLLISKVYEEELLRDLGGDEAAKENPIYKSKVRGAWSLDNPDGVIPLSYVRRCQDADREWAPETYLPVELGADIGGGGDPTTCRERRGVHVGRKWSWSTPDPMEAVGRIVQTIQETGATKVKVDVVGLGWGVAGRLEEVLKEQGINCQVVKVNVGESSTNPKRFPKKRDQMWVEVGREMMQDKLVDLCGLDEQTAAQLIAPTWSPNSKGQWQVEKKEDTISRIGRSPDDADAYLLAFCDFAGQGYWVR